MRQAIYMLVTADKYELPVFQGTPTETAIYLGLKMNALLSAVSRGYKFKCGGEKLMCVKVSDKWDEDAAKETKFDY